MWTFGRRLAAGFGLSFLLLAIIGIVAYRGVDTLTRTSYRVAHSHAIIERTAQLLRLLGDAETGQRGFVITGDETFLEPHNAAVAALPALQKALRDLTADDPDQRQRLDELDPVIARKLAELQKTIGAGEATPPEAMILI